MGEWVTPQAPRIEDRPGGRASGIEDRGDSPALQNWGSPPSKKRSILEKPTGFWRTTRFFVIGAIDFGGSLSGNLGFRRNPSLSNCPGLLCLLVAPPLSILEGPPGAPPVHERAWTVVWRTRDSMQESSRNRQICINIGRYTKYA